MEEDARFSVQLRRTVKVVGISQNFLRVDGPKRRGDEKGHAEHTPLTPTPTTRGCINSCLIRIHLHKGKSIIIIFYKMRLSSQLMFAFVR